MKNPKRHHTIPEFYLRGFADEGRLFIFDGHSKKIFPKSLAKALIEFHYYSFTDKSGKKNALYEKILSIVEDSAAPAIRKLDEGKSLSAEELGCVCLFICYLYMRTPATEKVFDRIMMDTYFEAMSHLFGSIQRAKETLNRHEDATNAKSTLTPEMAAKFAKSKTALVKPNRDHNLYLRMEFAKELFEPLAKMRWTFHTADKDSVFLTSDHPFTLVPPAELLESKYHIKTDGVYKVIPLSKRTCLSISNEGRGVVYNTLPTKFVSWLNASIFRNAHRFIVSDCQDTLLNVSREVLELYSPNPDQRS